MCRHFPPKISYADNLFVHAGCSNWKKLGDKISKHNDSTSHLEAVAQWSAAKQTDETGNVANKVDDHHKRNALKNRDAVAHLVRAALFCARQSIVVRGHRETETNEAGNNSSNRGNFVELCHLLDLANPDGIKHLQAKNAKYTSKQAQDEFVNAAATVIRKEIVDDAANAGMYALIVDEARDNSCSEQLSVCIRYVSSVTGSVVERFLGFHALTELSAESLSSDILCLLRNIGLSIDKCVAQAYDGASVMSGVKNGVQKLIRDAAGNPCPYVHCHAHRLNLVLVDLSKQVDLVSNTFGLLEAIHAFQSVSTLRYKVFLDSQAREVRILSIPRQSDTRWVCKYAGVFLL